MGKLISMSVFVVDSTVNSPSTLNAVNEDAIKLARPATTRQKQSFPSASGGINTAVYLNFDDNNSGQNHTMLINEAVSTLISGS